MSVKVVYENVAVGVEGNVTNTASEKQSFVDLTEIDRENNILNYGTLEGNSWKLSDDVLIQPDDLESIDLGYVSTQMSNSDCSFSAPIVITRTYNSNFTSPAITLTFDTYKDVYATEVNIKWYRGATLLYDLDFAPTHAVFACEQNVVAYNKVVITITKMNKPSRFLRIFKINDGVIRTFYEDEIVGLNIAENISDSGENLEINTLNLNVISKSSVKILWQKVQALKVYHDNVLFGTFFVENATRTGNAYELEAYDLVGMLDNNNYMGGLYNNVLASSLIADIMKDIPYELDNSLASERINGYLKIDSCRNSLMQVAFALNAVVDTSREDKVRIYPMPSNTPIVIDETRADTTFSEDINAPATQINLTKHKYINTTESISELYNEVLSGTITIDFGSPVYGLTITGGTIVESGTNYATISGTGSQVTLKGYYYNDIQTIVYSVNPLNTATTIPNIKEITNATLVNDSNASSIMTRLEEVLYNNSTLQTRFIMEDEKVGDYVSITTEEGVKTGQILSLEYDLLGNTIYTNAVIREVSNGN